MNKPKPYTMAEIKQINEWHASGVKLYHIAKRLGRTPNSIYLIRGYIKNGDKIRERRKLIYWKSKGFVATRKWAEGSAQQAEYLTADATPEG